YALKHGELKVTKSVTVHGAGQRRTVIDARRDSRVFDVKAPGAEVVLSGLAVVHGKAPEGGGILNAGSLTLRSVRVRDNLVAPPSGGLFGGGIATSGDLAVKRSAVIGNRARGDGFGGGIAASGSPAGPVGSVSIIRSTISRNQAAGAGGLLFQSIDPPGDQSVEIRESTFADNIADRHVTGNSVGGAFYYSVVTNSGSPEMSLKVTRTTFARNQAVGGIQGVGGAVLFEAIANSAATFPLTLVNDTFASNRAGDSNVRGIAGGLYLLGVFNDPGSSSTQALNALTIARNRATGPSGLGGGVLFEQSGTFASVFRNSIIALNHGANGPDCGTPTPTGGHNIEGGTSCDFTTGGDLQNTDPLLGQLADNGGPTQTLALLRHSPAIGAGNDATCPATDQRGVPRPQGGHCDIGAFERKRGE
ncbi:MAG TPA: choice-of-anchor Q domain-containing protein, partial [Solirubrobacterales bacterium]